MSSKAASLVLRRAPGIVFLLLILCTFILADSFKSSPAIRDIFDRDLKENGLVLIDVEGHIANPVMKYVVVPPERGLFPGSATIYTDCPRIYFNEPCEIDARGSSKTVTFDGSYSTAPIYMSIFPDRDTEDETHKLKITFEDARGRPTFAEMDIRVVDQDKNLPLLFNVKVDFSQDETELFKNEEARRVVEQSAADWAYFVDDMKLDTVPAGDEETFIEDPDDPKSGRVVKNLEPYTGFLLYAYGQHHSDGRSYGGPSAKGFQSSGGWESALRRSGKILMHTYRDTDVERWIYSTNDDEWFVSRNGFGERADFYSIVIHEIGHAMFLTSGYPAANLAEQFKSFPDPAIKEYLGYDLFIDNTSHFTEAIDPMSRKGTMGTEYHQDKDVKMPVRRWLITKLDILAMQAIGYKIRPTSAFVPLSILTKTLPPANVGVPYSERLVPEGGIAFYNWEVKSGALPRGLVLNTFTGGISGTPKRKGKYEFQVELHDYSSDQGVIVEDMAVEVLDAI